MNKLLYNDKPEAKIPHSSAPLKSGARVTMKDCSTDFCTLHHHARPRLIAKFLHPSDSLERSRSRIKFVYTSVKNIKYDTSLGRSRKQQIKPLRWGYAIKWHICNIITRKMGCWQKQKYMIMIMICNKGFFISSSIRIWQVHQTQSLVYFYLSLHE